MTRRYWPVFLAAVALLAGCGTDFVRDSAELDRALVPAIDFTFHREPGLARAALAELLPAWAEFAERHRDARPDEPGWAETFAEIDTLVEDVADMVESGEDLVFAAENLVDMRMMLAELRGTAGVNYLPDHLGELWEPVEELDRLAQRRGTEELALADLTALAVLLDEFDELLQDLVEARFEPGRFGFDRDRVEEYLAGLDALADAGAELALALEAANLDRALLIGRSFRPLFFDVYRLFGDYALAPPADETDPDNS